MVTLHFRNFFPNQYLRAFPGYNTELNLPSSFIICSFCIFKQFSVSMIATLKYWNPPSTYVFSIYPNLSFKLYITMKLYLFSTKIFLFLLPCYHLFASEAHKLFHFQRPIKTWSNIYLEKYLFSSHSPTLARKPEAMLCHVNKLSCYVWSDCCQLNVHAGKPELVRMFSIQFDVLLFL